MILFILYMWFGYLDFSQLLFVCTFRCPNGNGGIWGFTLLLLWTRMLSANTLWMYTCTSPFLGSITR